MNLGHVGYKQTSHELCGRNDCRETIYTVQRLIKMNTFKHYLRVSVKHLILQDHLPADLRAVIHNDIHMRPRAKLPLPVGDGGQGGNDEEGAADPHAENLIQKGDGLDSFSQPHFVCQYTVFSRRINRKENKRCLMFCHKSKMQELITINVLMT